MSRANEPAYPATVRSLSDDGNAFEIRRTKPGLTLREHFAGLAMQGVLSCEAAMGICEESAAVLGIARAEWIAKEAAAMADALIAELEKTA